MADIIQIIVTKTGERITTPIVYDKKTGDSVTAVDIVKAKKYKEKLKYKSFVGESTSSV